MFCFLHSLNNHSYDGHNSCRLIISIETMFIIGTIIKKSRKKWRKIKSNTPTWDSGRPIYFSLYDLTYNQKKIWVGDPMIIIMTFIFFWSYNSPILIWSYEFMIKIIVVIVVISFGLYILIISNQINDQAVIKSDKLRRISSNV